MSENLFKVNDRRPYETAYSQFRNFCDSLPMGYSDPWLDGVIDGASALQYDPSQQRMVLRLADEEVEPVTQEEVNKMAKLLIMISTNALELEDL